MRGFSFFSFAIFFASLLSANAQTYDVKVKTLADKTSFPVATFIMEVGSPQMKGFEGSIRAVGFGGEGIKPVKILEREIREKLTLEMKEELSLKDWEKLDNELEKLERELEKRERQLSRGAKSYASNLVQNGKKEKNAPVSKNRRRQAPAAQGDASASASLENYKHQEAYQKAKAKYDAFKASYDRAKRTRSVLKEMVAEIDDEIKEKYQRLIETPVIPDGTYPYGTFCSIEIKKIADNTVTFDFEYAISRILGWMEGEGTNNNNLMNNSLDIEYIEMPKKTNVTAELGKQYCFQIARPEKTFGSLDDAKSKTSIFSDSGKAEASMDEEEVRQRELANPLNAHGDYAQIRTKFKGKDKRVVRVLITITKKQNTTE